MPQNTNLSSPPELAVSQVAPDTFFRPRQDPTAGQRLSELAQGLSYFRPALNALVEKDLDERKDSEFAQGIKDFNQYRDLIKAGNASMGGLNDLKKGKSMWWVQGLEMSQAQVAAHDYHNELYETILPLAQNEKTTPEQVNQAVAAVRQKYLAQGEGSGSVWTKTFNQYSLQAESGVMQQFYEALSSTREQTMEQDLTGHLAELFSGTNAAANPNEAAKFLQDEYATKSFHGVSVSGTQLNRAARNGMLAAVQKAVADKKFDQADQLIDSFRGLKTPYGALSDIDGGSTLSHMLQEVVAAKRDSKYDQAQAREQLKEDLNTRFWKQFIEPNYNKPVGAWNVNQAQLKDFLGSAASIGLDAEFQSKLTAYKQMNSASSKEGFQEDLIVAQKDASLLQRDILEKGPDATESDITEFRNRAHELASTPAGAMATNTIISELNTSAEGFKDGKKFSSPVISSNIRRFEQSLNDEIRVQTQGLSARLRDAANNKDDSANALIDSLNRHHIRVADTSSFSLDMGDYRERAVQNFINNLDNLRQGRPWEALTDAEISKQREVLNSVWNTGVGNAVKNIETDTKDVASSPDALLLKAAVDSTKGANKGIPLKVASDQYNAGVPWFKVGSKDPVADYGDLLSYTAGHTVLDEAIGPRFLAGYQQQAHHPDNPALHQDDLVDTYRNAYQQKASEEEGYVLSLFKKKDDGKALTRDERLHIYQWSVARKQFFRISGAVGVPAETALAVPPGWLAEDGRVPKMSFLFKSPEELKSSLPKLIKHYNWTDSEAGLFIRLQLEDMAEFGNITPAQIEELKKGFKNGPSGK